MVNLFLEKKLNIFLYNSSINFLIYNISRSVTLAHCSQFAAPTSSLFLAPKLLALIPQLQVMNNNKAPVKYIRVKIENVFFDGFKNEKEESDLDAVVRIIKNINTTTNTRYKACRDDSGWYLVDTKPTQNILHGDLATKYIRIMNEGQLYNIKINEGEIVFDAALRMTVQGNGRYNPKKDSNNNWYLLEKSQ